MLDSRWKIQNFQHIIFLWQSVSYNMFNISSKFNFPLIMWQQIYLYLSISHTIYLPGMCPLWFRIYSAGLLLLSLSRDQSPTWPWFCPDRHASCSPEQIPPPMHSAPTFSWSCWSSYGCKCLGGFLSVLKIFKRIIVNYILRKEICDATSAYSYVQKRR